MSASITVAEPKTIPKDLIRETINGVNYYYRGTAEVLRGEKTKEQIMGDSILQGFMKTFLAVYLSGLLTLDKYLFLVGEQGLNLKKRNNLSLDAVIYRASQWNSKNLSRHYSKKAPVVVLEIDLGVEELDLTGPEPRVVPEATTRYFFDKIDQLHTAGTERVVWIFMDRQRLLVSENGIMRTLPWSESFELIDGIEFNFEAFLKHYNVQL